jgi:hypothetical protein
VCNVFGFALAISVKAIFSTFDFPYFVFMSVVHFLTALVLLNVLYVMKKVEIPRLSWQIVKDISPLSVANCVTIITALGGSRHLNIPMYLALRRFSIPLTMACEWYIFSVRPTKQTYFAVTLMVGGSALAAAYDFSFDSTGCILVATSRHQCKLDWCLVLLFYSVFGEGRQGATVVMQSLVRVRGQLWATAQNIIHFQQTICDFSVLDLNCLFR